MIHWSVGCFCFSVGGLGVMCADLTDLSVKQRYLGTEVTTPVPLPMEMVRSGSVYTRSNGARGADSGRPSRSHLCMYDAGR